MGLDFDIYMSAVYDRMDEFTYELDFINRNKEYFRDCMINNLSPYKALVFLNDEYWFD